MKDKKFLLTGGFAGVLGSLCCIGPVIIVFLGLGSVSTALAIGKYTWLFTLLAVVFFSVSLILYLKKNNSCNIKGVKNNWKLILTSFLIMVLFLFLLKFKIAPLLAKLVYR